MGTASPEAIARPPVRSAIILLKAEFPASSRPFRSIEKIASWLFSIMSRKFLSLDRRDSSISLRSVMSLMMPS